MEGVSSVLDVRQKDGNSKNFALTGGIGAISSRLAAEGPIFNDRGSFLVAGRGSYAHLFLKLAGEENSVSFYDLNLKTNYNLSKNDKLFLSGYFGRDVFEFGGSFSSSYGNASGNLRWNHIFNDRLFSNLSLIYSKYDYELSINDFEFDWISSITNYNAKYDLKYYFSDAFKLDFGVSTLKYEFDPGQIKPKGPDSAINELQLEQKRALESAAYVNAEHKLTDRLTAQYGVRLSHFNRMGGQQLSVYANDQPLAYNSALQIYQRTDPIDEITYKKSESIKTFANLEPRASLAYQLNDYSSIKLGYSRAAQYIHLLSNTSSVTPLDVWTTQW